MLERVREQINERAKRPKVAPVAADQFLVTLVSSCLSPFAARPTIAAVLALDASGVTAVIERRRKELPQGERS
jgi:hypothetical protein